MPALPHLRLGVNIDHVATIRNARGGLHPDPVRAAKLAIAAGADGVTAHLREDRRHISDDDIARLKAEIAKPLNLEMAATAEMLAIALRTRPHAACLVPERRAERTTEGGLDVVGGRAELKPRIAEMRAANIRVSLFIAADPAQIEEAAALGAPVIEIHTGAWCHALADGDKPRSDAEWLRIREGAEAGQEASGSKFTPATASTTPAPKPSPLCRRSRSSTSAIFWSARRCSSDSMRPSRPCAVPWIAGAPRPDARHDPRHRVRHHGRAPRCESDRAARRPVSPSHFHGDRAGARRPAEKSRRDLRQALRRQGSVREGSRHRHTRPASGGGTWGWSTVRAGSRP